MGEVRTSPVLARFDGGDTRSVLLETMMLDYLMICIGCWFIGDYSTALGWGLWFICSAFYKVE